jgi:hypothetical protein
LDLRLMLGVLLVLVSVVAGARVVAAADRTRPVWALTHDLAPGSVLRAEDLVRRQVQLASAADRYLPAAPGDASPVGYVLTRSVSPDELLPRDALRDPATLADRREVSVPVDAGHRPADLVPGQLVDVFVTVKASGGASGGMPGGVSGGPSDGAAGATRVVLRTATVLSVGDRGRDGGDAVVVAVPAAEGAALVGAVRSGSVDLVRVPVTDDVVEVGG